jgi:hypothetical protein
MRLSAAAILGSTGAQRADALRLKQGSTSTA